MIIHVQNVTDLVSKPCKTRLVQTSYTTIQLEVAVLDQEVKRSHKKLQNEHCTILQQELGRYQHYCWHLNLSRFYDSANVLPLIPPLTKSKALFFSSSSSVISKSNLFHIEDTSIFSAIKKCIQFLVPSFPIFENPFFSRNLTLEITLNFQKKYEMASKINLFLMLKLTP